VIENPHHRLEDARLCLICTDIEDARLDAALRGGVDIVEIMDSDASDAEVLAVAARLRAICERHGVPLMLNNRPGLVEQAGADGVHVDAPGLDIALARETVGANRILGTSAHTRAEIDAAQVLPVDYISIGPVHATPTRPNRPAAGHGLVTYASRNSRLPFFAVGGIEPHNTGAVAAAGGRRVAVVRAITQATDPERSAMVLRSEIETPVDFLERYRARTEASNAAARAKLTPLQAGERPWPLKAAVGLAALSGLINVIAYAAGAKVNGSSLSGGEIAAFALIALMLAVGMWQRNDLALLAFMAVLGIVVLLFSLFLIEASNLLGVVVPLAFIGFGGYLFWKLIRVLGRIQTPSAQGSQQA
jgi:thiamine-phosphate pyrophosphorylase